MSDPWGRLCDVRELVTSAAAQPRLECARQWLQARGASCRALIVGATQEAAAEMARAAAFESGAAFGWQRFTLGRLAAAVAAQALLDRGLSPVSPLGVEALCARVIHQLRGRLGKFDAVAQQPGLPRALSRTLQEARLAGARPSGDLGCILDAYDAELRRAALADRAEVFRLALEAESPLWGLPALLVDLPLRSPLEERFIARLSGPVLAVARIAPRPLLIIHGEDDATVPVHHAEMLYEAAGEPKELWRLAGVGHVGAYFADRAEYIDRVTSFFRSALAGAAVAGSGDLATA